MNKKSIKSKKKSFKATTWDVSSGEKETKSSSSKNEREAYLMLKAKMDPSSNLKDINYDEDVNLRYDEFFL